MPMHAVACNHMNYQHHHHVPLDYVCLYADMLCRWYACYVYMICLHPVYILISCRYALCTSGVSGIYILMVVVWVGPQDATLAGLQRIMRRRGGSQSNTVTTQSTVPNKDGVAWPLLLL